MLGTSLWILLAVIVSFCGLAAPLIWLRSRPWTYRLLLGLGLASLVWGVAPVLGGGTLSPLPVAGAIVAFGFLILADSTSENDAQW